MTLDLRVRARKLDNNELHQALRCTVAVLNGASYLLLDLAIAEAMDRSIRSPGAVYPTAAQLHQKQKELPKIEAQISRSWLEWASSTRENWDWMASHYQSLRDSYVYRLRRESPWNREFRIIYLLGPRPRSAGRTPFPLEPC